MSERHTKEPAADYEDWLAAHQMVKRLQAELAALRAERDELRAALRELAEDGECYCSDNVAARGPCGHCKARAALARAERKA